MIRLLLALLLLASPAAATDLKVATWNIGWLTLRHTGDPILPEGVTTRTPADFALLRAYAEHLDADVVGFQEVDGAAAAAAVFPPDRYTIVITNDDVTQRTGFAIRRGLRFERNPDVAGLDVQPNARFRLRSGADITLVTPDARLRILDVHLKTGCHHGHLDTGSRNCETLGRQVAPLQGWLNQRREDGTPFLVIGDFNREMDGRDELLAALRTVTPLARATEGMRTPCWGGNSFIDHILAGGAARAWLEPGSLKVMTYRETDPAFKDRLSDHCAVSVRVRLPG